MAGFFALLYGMFMLSGKTVNNTKKDIERSESKKKAIENHDLTYYVGGECFFTENDLPCICTRDSKTRHKVIVVTKGIYANKILYDFDEVELKKERIKIETACEEAKNKNSKYVKYKFNVLQPKYMQHCGVEIDSNKKYIVYECLAGGEYYLQYLESEPTNEWIYDNYHYVYKFKDEPKKISKEEYLERSLIR